MSQHSEGRDFAPNTRRGVNTRREFKTNRKQNGESDYDYQKKGGIAFAIALSLKT